MNLVQSSIFCALAKFRKYPPKRRHSISRRSFGENGSSGYCYCKTLCWTFYPAHWGWGGSRGARKLKLPASHTFYPWLMPLWFPFGSCVFVQNLYCKISWKVAMFGFFSPLRKPTSLHPVPLPPSHLLFFQDKTLPVHKLTQHYDPVSSQVQCQNTEASSILILLEEKKCVLSK